MSISQYIRPISNRPIAQIEAIENGFLVKFHEPTKRPERKGLPGRIEEEVRREFERSIPEWTTREVSLYCSGAEEVKAAIDKAVTAYAKISTLVASGDIDGILGPGAF